MVGYFITRVACDSIFLLSRVSILLFICWTAGLSAESLQDEKNLTVSPAYVPGVGMGSVGLAKFFVKRIAMGRPYRATLLKPVCWNGIPAGADSARHVNIYQTRIGKRLELLAFIFASDGKSILLAARAPALCDQPPLRYYMEHMASPGDYQLPGNAPADLVINFAYGYEHKVKFRNRYQLILREWQPDSKVKAPAAKTDVLPGSAEVAKLYPIAAAAMYADRFQTLMKFQSDRILLEFRTKVIDCDIRASLFRKGKKVLTISRYGIRYESLYNALRILFFNLVEWRNRVTGFGMPGSDRFALLSAVNGEKPVAENSSSRKLKFSNSDCLLVGKQWGSFLVVDPLTKKRLWRIPLKNRIGERSYWKDGQILCCSRKNVFKRLDLRSGKALFSMKMVADDISKLSLYQDYTVDGSYQQLSLYDKGKRLWQKKLDWVVEAGPLLTGQAVFYGDGQGMLRAIDYGGRQLWQTRCANTLKGRLAKVGSLILGTDDLGRLYVVNAAGKQLWQADIGDVVLDKPWVDGNRLFVASKDNALFVFDKDSGKVLKTKRFKTWLTLCQPVGQSIFCLDLRKKLSILNSRDLSLEAELHFPFKLRNVLVPVSSFSPRMYQIDDFDIAPKSAGYLLADVKGFVYFFPKKK